MTQNAADNFSFMSAILKHCQTRRLYILMAPVNQSHTVSFWSKNISYQVPPDGIFYRRLIEIPISQIIIYL
jgi:hypothetical protein